MMVGSSPAYMGGVSNGSIGGNGDQACEYAALPAALTGATAAMYNGAVTLNSTVNLLAFNY